MPHKKQNYNRPKALTLLEMVIALAIVSVLFAVVLPVFTNAKNSWSARQASSEAIQNGRVLVDYINRQLTKAVKIIDVSDSSQTNGYIEYEDAAGTTLRFDIAANNYVQFGEIGSQSELAGPVTKLQFTCYAIDDLSATITDTDSIRFIKVETSLTNTASPGKEKIFSTSAYLQTNWDSALTSPLGWWKLDEASGFTATDSSGADNHGTLNNMSGDEWTTGVDGGALVFDGVDDYIDGIGECPTGSYTVTAWVRDTGPEIDSSTHSTVYSAGQEIWFGVDRGSSPALWIDSGGNGNGARTALGSWDRDTWHHVAVTWDGTDLHVYLDGIDMPTTIYGTPANAAAISAAIGAYSVSPGDQTWYGDIDDIRIYGHVLNNDQIAALANKLRFCGFSEAKDDVGENFTTIPIPVGTKEGDMLIVAVIKDGTATMTPAESEKWTFLGTKPQVGSVTMGVWWRIAEDSEQANHQFTMNKIKKSYSFMIGVRGYDTDSPINGYSENIGTSAIPISGDITTTVEGCMILRIGGFDENCITVDDAGMSGHSTITMDESGSGLGSCSGGAAYAIQSAIGDSGTANFTLTSSQQYRMVTLGIAPDSQTIDHGIKP